MSEPTTSSTSYTDRALNELKMLSESVETPRIHAMQTNFQNIAHQVDDVINELRTLQKDLPHWWSGAASEAATAALGRVVTHAETTHQVAVGASQALRICAQVVDEQQSAMRNIPDVAIPTDAETHPYAGRVSTATAVGLPRESHYEAARVRAVGLVQGVAAQFVETRAQMGGLLGFYSESFEPVDKFATQSEVITPPTPAARLSRSPTTNSTIYRTLLSQQDPESTYKEAFLMTDSLASTPRVPPTDLPVNESWVPYKNYQASAPRTLIPLSSSHQKSSTTILPNSSSSHQELLEKHSDVQLQSPIKTTSRNFLRSHSPSTTDLHLQPTGSEGRIPNPSSGASDQLVEEMPKLKPSSAIEPGTNSADSQMMGPLGIGGNMANRRENEATKRPSYLKEKNLWTPSEPMAPPGGLLTADWAEPQ